MKQILLLQFPDQNDSFGKDEEDAAVRSLSISQHGNFLSPPAFAADLSSTFPLHTRLSSRDKTLVSASE